MTSLLAALGALGLLTVLPGPDVALVTRTALAHGRRAAFGAALGISTGCLAWGLAVAAGLAALLAASPLLFTVVRWAGAAYLVGLGVRAWWSTFQAGDGEAPQVGAAAPSGGSSMAAGWRTGLVGNLLNPKIAAFYTGLLPQLVPPGWAPGPTLVGLVLAHDLMGLIWLNGCAWMLHRGRGVLDRPRPRRVLERLTGSALIGFGVRVALRPH